MASNSAMAQDNDRQLNALIESLTEQSNAETSFYRDAQLGLRLDNQQAYKEAGRNYNVERMAQSAFADAAKSRR